MNFELKLNIPDAEQEVVWLNDFIREHRIEGLETELQETTPERGTMDGGILTGILALVLTQSVVQGVAAILGVIFKQFDGKKAEFELTGECPDTGKSFTLTFNNTSAKNRDAAYIEFEHRYKEICSPAPETIEEKPSKS